VRCERDEQAHETSQDVGVMAGLGPAIHASLAETP
jgi:hypothetical protein